MGPPRTKKKTLPSNENIKTSLKPEEEDQFQLELCWCVQQLEACLINGKLQNKQAFDLAKNINLLKSSSVPLIKKRQVMRNTLGDYRDQMAQDQVKYQKTVSNVKFSSAASNKKSVFLKKAAKQTDNKETTSESASDVDISKNVPDSAFRFNFQ